MKFNRKNLFLNTLFLILIWSFLACQNSTSTHCQEADWFELGRRVSSLGQANPYLQKPLPLVCPQSENTYYIKLYNNGYNQGLVEFCRPEVAFEMGRSGLPFNNICPKENHSNLLSSYKKGQKFLELDKANIELIKKIDDIHSEQKSPRTQPQKRSEILKLEKLKASLELQMRELESNFSL